MLPSESSQKAGAAGAIASSADPRRGRWRVSSRLLIPLGTTVGLLALWELLARAGALPAEVPPFTEVVSWLAGEFDDGTFWDMLGQTLWHWFAGLLIGGAAGIVVGGTIGMVPFVHRLLNVPLEFLRPIPAIVYLPLLILVMGSRSVTAIILASLGALWPMLFQSVYGVRAIDAQVVETGKVFGLRRRQILWHIMLPSVLPYLATGVRIASSLSLIVAVSAELVGGIPGLGTEMAAAAQNGRYTATYGLLLVSGVLGLLLNAALEGSEKRLLRWHVSHRVVNA
ncbi:ABC transporter permease [Streptomyces blattellae]|uniref:ABC transporter permease n=1 Tax=Streptomyces blattellae TaxID=2569855 RepID=UPI0012B8F4DF|nr:ABC transporter permease [Streptomyces blattellae]